MGSHPQPAASQRMAGPVCSASARLCSPCAPLMPCCSLGAAVRQAQCLAAVPGVALGGAQPERGRCLCVCAALLQPDAFVAAPGRGAGSGRPQATGRHAFSRASGGGRDALSPVCERRSRAARAWFSTAIAPLPPSASPPAGSASPSLGPSASPHSPASASPPASPASASPVATASPSGVACACGCRGGRPRPDGWP